MLFLILRQNLQRFAKFFLSLIDCLITSKCEGQELGSFAVETLPLLVLVSLESMEVKSGLILVAVTPFRNKDVEAKEEQLELFCTEIDGFWWEYVVAELLVEMCKHVDCSSSRIRCLSQRLECPELEKHAMGICYWIQLQTNPHREIWAFEKCNLPPFNPPRTKDYSVLRGLSNLERQSTRMLNIPGMWRILWITLCSRHQWKTSYTSIHKLAECVPPCLLTLVLLNPDIPCLCKQCRSRSVGFWRSQLIWSCTVCH